MPDEEDRMGGQHGVKNSELSKLTDVYNCFIKINDKNLF